MLSLPCCGPQCICRDMDFASKFHDVSTDGMYQKKEKRDQETVEPHRESSNGIERFRKKSKRGRTV